MTALELAKYCNVSKRTILRDIDDLENQGVKIYAHYGKKWLPNAIKLHTTNYEMKVSRFDITI